MRIVGILATLVVIAVGFWAKVKYSEIEAQIPGNTDNGSQVADLQSGSDEGFSPYTMIDSVMSWFTSTGDGSTANPYTGNESRAIDFGNVETNSFVDEATE